MVAHYRLNPQIVQRLALTNAATNMCLAQGMIDKTVAYDFSNTAAQYLDLTVSDGDYYKQEYDKTWKELSADVGNVAKMTEFCHFLETDDLPKGTTHLRQHYAQVAQDLHVARALENQHIAQAMRSFGTFAPQPVTMVFPKVTYKSEPPAAQNYIVNTKSGLAQCRVTETNFVFCI